MEIRIKHVMAVVFEVDINQINENTSPDCLEKWDSLGHMNIILALEEEFGATFTDDEIAEMLNFELINMILRNKDGLK